MLGEAYLKRVADLWEKSAKLYPKRFRPGVYKYRSIEEMNQDQSYIID